MLYVASRNVNLDGPAPHHTSSCGGRNGFFHVISLKTLKSIKAPHELSVDPYSIGIK
ncbi:MAG: hypothetical protein R2831_00400 [Chitinophagaceae bacterium]